MRFSCGEAEIGVFGWFFERLQERIERAGTQHVNLVDHVNLCFSVDRCVPDAFAQFPYVVDSRIRCGVDFNRVDKPAIGDFDAWFAFATGFAVVHG